jgi:hypothetical protein
MSLEWRQPPGWPVPPPGWTPPRGWHPPPSWPSAPVGWSWWVKVHRSGRQRLRLVALIALPCVVLFVACGVVGSVYGGCAVDFPPGDQSSFIVTNDSPDTVGIAACGEGDCSTRYDLRTVQPGGTGDAIVDVCNHLPIGVTSADGSNLSGCIRLPTVDPPERYTYSVSDAMPCA